MNIQKKLTLTTFLILLPVSAFAQNRNVIDRQQLGSYFDVQYGYVTELRKVKIKSDAPKTAIMGGMIGGATSGHKHRGRHALEGAVAGAMLQSLLEKHNKKAYQYRVEFVSGGETRIVTEQGGVREGDCVSIERGKTANIRRVSDAHCKHHNHEAYSHPIIHAKRQTQAAECEQAKEIAMRAKSERDIDIAIKKVHIFCD